MDNFHRLFQYNIFFKWTIYRIIYCGFFLIFEYYGLHFYGLCFWKLYNLNGHNKYIKFYKKKSNNISNDLHYYVIRKKLYQEKVPVKYLIGFFSSFRWHMYNVNVGCNNYTKHRCSSGFGGISVNRIPFNILYFFPSKIYSNETFSVSFWLTAVIEHAW